MKLSYLACPYWHEQPAVRELRVLVATRAAAYITDHYDIIPYNAIQAGHCLLPWLPPGSNQNHDRWLQRDLRVLSSCDSIILLPLPGWQQSSGVQRELRFARQHSIPLYIVESDHPGVLPLGLDELDSLGEHRVLLVRFTPLDGPAL